MVLWSRSGEEGEEEGGVCHPQPQFDWLEQGTEREGRPRRALDGQPVQAYPLSPL